MTRTHIIAADGTRFEEITARAARRRKIASRIIGAGALLITALLLSAALIGFHRAAIEGAPDDTKIADYNDGWTDALGDIVDQHKANPELVNNCIRISRTADELHDCLS